MRASAAAGERGEALSPHERPVGPPPIAGARHRALIGPGSLVQGTVPADRHPLSLLRVRRLEAVVLDPDAPVLRHYHRDQTRPDRPWVRGAVISDRATGPGVIVQESGWWGLPAPARLGSTAAGLDSRLTIHASTRATGFAPAATVGRARGARGRSARLFTLGGPGPLHVLVPEGPQLWGHYVRETAWRRPHEWRRGGEFGGVSAMLAVGAGHVWVRAERPSGAWEHAVWTPQGWRPATPPAEVVAAFEGGTPGADDRSAAFDPASVAATAARLGAAPVVAVAAAPSALASGGVLGEVLAALPGAGGAPASPTRGSGGRGWRQALVQEGASLYQWHEQRWRGRTRWVRAACLRFDPGDGALPDAPPSRKLAQVTGDRDTQPGSTDATLSASWTASGIRGTDLGVRVDHAGDSYLLFGDTHWAARTRVTRDVIGRLTPAGPVPGLPGVALHGSPTRIVGGPATAREYDVPLDGFSADGELFVFASSHHFQRHQVMGRSLLTRSVARRLPIDPAQRHRPLDFTHLGTFSDRFFINVSCVRRGDTLYVWGSGSYRADDLRLAALDLAHPDLRRVLSGGRRWGDTWRRPRPGVSYLAGVDPAGGPVWSASEDDAVAVVPGAFGELSVRWVEPAGCYVLLAMSGPEDPLGPCVTLRTAAHPWGPWTPRRRLFDWVVSGMSHHDEASRFIRAHADDPVGDALFKPQRTMTGAAYAPYVFSAEPAPDGRLALRYTLSTWNPYQVVLMESLLDLPLDA